MVGSFSSQMRPFTLSTPLPLIEFCNKTLLMHQLTALKAAGVVEVIYCVRERDIPAVWDQAIRECEEELGIRVISSREEDELGTAGPLKQAEALITNDGTDDSPFLVINSDVLCNYPLRDLCAAHVVPA